MTDFQALIQDLSARCGLTETEIGDLAGLAQTSVNRIKHEHGAEPRYSVGVRLIKLHEREMRRLKRIA